MMGPQNPLVSAAPGGGVGTNKLLTPWLDYTSTALPSSHELVLWWAQFMWLTDGNYRTAMERVAAHFLTVLEFPELDPEEESVWKDLFQNHLNYRRELMALMYDWLAYGNLFVSLYLPFIRFMRCRGCGFEQPIDRVDYNLNMSGTEPYLTWNRVRPCPRCQDRQSFEVMDRRSSDLSRIKIIRYSPLEIEMAYNPFSQRKDIFWRIPQRTIQDIRNKSRIHIDTTPMEVLETVATGGKLCFNEDMILHHDEPTVSGVQTHGWGIPRSISNFRTAWLQQQMNKLDQAVAIDYTLGMRLLSPKATAGGEDPMVDRNMTEFPTVMKQIVDTHRNNPTTYHSVPYAVEYQFLGGEGGALMPFEKLKFRQQEYLNQLGVPLEYHQMNLTTQAAPMALRLFESYWQAVPAAYNRVLSWVVDILSRVYGFTPTDIVMQKTTIADDMERKHIMLQLMSGNQISPQTALQPFGINAHDEVKKVMKHQDFIERAQAEQEEREIARQEMGALKGLTAQPTPTMLMQEQQMAAEQQAMGGAPGPMGAAGGGGMPMGGAPGMDATPKSLQQMSEQAFQIAQQLVSMDEYSRKQELRNLRQGNKDLHALVMQNMQEIRSQARSEGGQMLLQGGM